MPRRGAGRRGQSASWTHMLHPGGSLSYPASVCLPMEWVPVGDSGDRGARRTLEARLCGGGHLRAAPSSAALAVAPSSSPRHRGSWEPEPRFGLRGWRRAGARPSRGHQASEGGLPYLQVLSPHVHCCKGQLHLLPASILVPLVGNLDEDQEDPGHDAPGHQHEDPCGPRPSASAAGGPGSQPPGSPPGVSTGVGGVGGPPAMFSNVRVAGALLRESHSWYRTHVLSRSSMKPFSWDLGRRGM